MRISSNNRSSTKDTEHKRLARISRSSNHTTTMQSFVIFLLLVTNAVALFVDTAERKLQNNDLLEATQCIEPSVVKSIYIDPNDNRLVTGSPSVTEACINRYDYCGSTMGPAACCRVSFELGWAVCDSANGFYSAGMACICNENTDKTPSPTVSPQPTQQPVMPTPAPTNLPTPAPVKPPTRPPTLAPSTDFPSSFPTAQPSDSPTIRATPSPSASPSAQPVTPAPVVPTPAPVVPTPAPVVPTPAPVVPTLAPVAPTPSPVVPSDAPIASVPEATQPPVTATTDVPTTQSSDGNLSPGTDFSWETENRVDGDFVRQTQCVQAPPTVSLVETSTFSYTYQVVADPNGVDDPRTSGRFVTMLTDEMHDALAEEFFTCDYSEDAVWIMQSSLHDVLAEECQGGSVQNGGACVVMQATHRVLVFDAREAEGRSVGGDYRLRNLQETSDRFASAMIDFVDEGMANGQFSIDGLTMDMSFDEGDIFVTTIAPTNNPVAGTDAPLPVDLATPSPSAATAAGGDVNNIEGGSTAPPSDGKSGLSAPYIATIVVASAFVLLVALMLVSRRKRRNSQQDDEYLRKGNISTMEVDHLEIDSASPGNESMIRAINTPGSRDPIVLTSFSMDEDYEDPFTSRSPSKRSKRGPLTSQDELDRSFDSEEEGIVGNHRGGVPPTTPRTYPVQDTVNL